MLEIPNNCPYLPLPWALMYTIFHLNGTFHSLAFWIINYYVITSFEHERYHLSLCQTYWVDPISLSVLLASLQHVFVLGVTSFVPSSSSSVKTPSRHGVLGTMLSSLSFNSIIPPSRHILYFFSSTLLLIVLTSTS